ncbi:hypothetical protein [Streptomyces sp. NPDC048606]
MALRKTMPMAPGTKPDPRHETTYQASRGGHHLTPAKLVPGAKKDNG